MKVKMIPQIPVNLTDRIVYKFTGEVIEVKLNGAIDYFDFTGVPDGEIELADDDGNNLMQTNLDVFPIISAKRESGVLCVELLNYVGIDATGGEKFPLWIDAKDYTAPRIRRG